MTESVAVSLANPRKGAPGAPGTHPAALTRHASLNAVAALLDYAAQVAAGLLLAPLLVRGLGPALFGSWEMLLRLGGYVSATDGRPTEALRLVVARSHALPSEDKRRLVGAAISVWMLLSPLVILLGVLLITVAPGVVGVGADQAGAIRVAATCLVGSMLIGTLAAVPESVLRGLNLGHTRMGIQAVLHLFGAALAALAIWSGLGVAGLGGATLLRGIATGLCFWALVTRRVPWFGIARPDRESVRAMLGMSLWLTAGELLARLVLASDVVILGTFVSPAAVATYVLTGYAARVAIGVHVFTAGEAMPGIGALLGAAEYARARRARRELLTMTWLYATVAATTVLLWNRTFISLWVGSEHHAGRLVDLLIVIAAGQTAFIRLDAGMIDAALLPRQRVVVAGAAAAVTLLLAILLTSRFGMVGLCAGIIAGRSVQSVAYPILVHRALRATAATAAAGAEGRASWGRPVVAACATTVVLLAAAWVLGRAIAPAAWSAFVTGVLLTIATTALTALSVGIPAATRAAVVKRVRGLLAPRRSP